MQRWIGLGVVAMVLLLGGGVFGYRTYKQNRPHPVWVPMPINPALPVEKRDAIASELKAKLLEPEILIQISKDLGLAKKFGLPTDEAAAREIARRLFVKIDEMDGPMGKVPSISIGVSGKNKEQEVSGEIALRLMADVWKILGIKPPPREKF